MQFFNVTYRLVLQKTERNGSMRNNQKSILEYFGVDSQKELLTFIQEHPKDKDVLLLVFGDFFLWQLTGGKPYLDQK